MLAGGTSPLLTAPTIQVAALSPGELASLNCGLPFLSRIVPPSAPVVSYQYVERPSAAENGMFSGCFASPLACTCFRSFVYWSRVDGIELMPARANMSLLTVVTMNDAS